METSGDYVSDGLEMVQLDHAFPNMITANTEVNSWPYLRRDIGHNWYVDRRTPTVGFVSRDEASILYNSARLFRGKPCVEIGCWRGWSSAHVAKGSDTLVVFDPILADDTFRSGVEDSLRAAGVLDKVRLVGLASPDGVELLEQQSRTRWGLTFIDGDHEGLAPLRDAIQLASLAADDAMILLHDLMSPDVTRALLYLRSIGWNVRVYMTSQIMAVAWRGDVEPVRHVPDPSQPWWAPAHLSGLDVSGIAAGAIPFRRLVEGEWIECSAAEAAEINAALCLETDRAVAEIKTGLNAEVGIGETGAEAPLDGGANNERDYQSLLAFAARVRQAVDSAVSRGREHADNGGSQLLEQLQHAVNELDNSDQSEVLSSIPSVEHSLEWLSSREELEARFAELAPLDVETVGALVQQSSSPGWCPVCSRETSFRVTGGEPEGHWRNLLEGMICPECGTNGRVRLGMLAWRELRAQHDFEVSLVLEQVTPLFGLLRAEDTDLMGCEFLGADKVSGETYEHSGNQVRHESMLGFSMPDASLDLLMHFDVLEHVPGHREGVAECARVLRPGGSMLFTLPFFAALEEHRVRARPDGRGGIEHLMPEAYHGNPVGDGALVFIEPGWELLSDLDVAGFDTRIGLLYDPRIGIVSNGCPFPDGHMWPVIFHATRRG